MTVINVKKVTYNDRVSPVGGEKLAKKVLPEIKKANQKIIIDFSESGSHTSLFFNAFYGLLFKNDTDNIKEVISKIELTNLTKLDVETSEKCRENSARQYSDSEYRVSIENLGYEEKE